MQLETLRDGETVLLRNPTSADLEAMLGFFAGLPVEERRYLRGDVTNPAWVAGLLREADAGNAERLIALQHDLVVGHGALVLSSPDGWQRHMAEIRVLVAHGHRRRRLGAHLIAALFRRAQDRGLDKVRIKVPTPQSSVVRMCERLGFRMDAVLPGRVIDQDDLVHDLAVLTCGIDAVSTELREFYRDDNWPDG